MAKVCVFCGEKPDEKSKEHVVPRWLIELTGDPKREAFLGFIKDFENGFKERKFSFDQLTFPACVSCNNKYADLEGKVKPILERILNKEQVTTEALSLFLDWLDKVRIGLWLGMIQLDKNYADVDPNFHIETRISQYDRMLIVEKSDSDRSKLNLGGIDTLSFSLTPSAFVLIVNNYYFTNISYMFLLHRRLGFPYPNEMYIQPDDERIEANFVHGRNRIMRPLLRKAIEENGSIFYQPMFRGGLIEGHISEYDNDYVKSHSLSFENGVGNIFQEENGGLIEHKLGSSFLVKPSTTQKDEKLFIKSAINVCKWQNWLVQFMPKPDRLSRDQIKYVKSRFRTGVKVNEIFIKHHESML
ncbi:MAG: hypothetical protein ACI9OH_001560 [Oleispira sp.]